MIEAIVAYIEEQGFEVRVSHAGTGRGFGVLSICKAVGDLVCRIDWAISPTELAVIHKEVLFYEADHRLAQLLKAIAEGPGKQ